MTSFYPKPKGKPDKEMKQLREQLALPQREAMISATIMMIVGLGILYSINPLTAGFGALSIFIYTLVYTTLISGN